MKNKTTMKKLLTATLLNFLIVSNTVSAMAAPVVQSISIHAESYSESLQENEVDPADEWLLHRAHTPTLEENFAEDKVRVLIKHRYSVVNAEITMDNLNDFLKIPENDNTINRELLDFAAVEDKSLHRPEPDNGLLNVDEFHQSFILTLKNSNKQKVLDTAEELLKCEGVISAGPDYIKKTELSFVPADPHYDGNTYSQWYAQKVGLDKAWDSATGKNVKVGIIESGFSQHSDIANNFVQKISGNAETKQYHGTGVAGVLSAQGNNNLGICGTAPDSKLYVFTNGLEAAVNYAIENNITILNASFSHVVGENKEPAPPDSSEEAALRMYQGLLVASAGNRNNNNDIKTYYPSGYAKDFNNVVAVGATTSSDEVCDFSSYGKATVNLFAPGKSIVCTGLDDGYVVRSGTSFSAPLVAGVAALMLEKNRDLQPSGLKYALMSSTDKLSNLTDLCVSGGRLNAEKAIKAVTITKYASNLPAIVKEEVHLRTWHSTDSGTSIKKLSAGTKLTILGYYKDSPNWLFAKTKSGEKGYVSKLYLDTEDYTKYAKNIPAVVKESVKLRTSPSTDSEILQNAVPVNTTLRLLGYCQSSPNWVFAKLEDGQIGFISKLYLNTYDYTAHNKNIPAACSSDLSLRGGPSTSSPSITTMSAGTPLEIMGYYASSVNWVCVKLNNGKIGYASKLYMDLYDYTAYSVGRPSVVKQSVSLRGGPSTDSEVLVASVTPKTRITVHGYYPESTGWVFVTISDEDSANNQKRGYMSKLYLNMYEYTKYSPALTGTTTYQTSLRDGSDTSANVRIPYIAPGNTFTAIGYCPTSVNWIYVKLSNGKTGYISKLNTDLD